MKKWSFLFPILLIVFSTILSWHQIISMADGSHYFGDEIANDQSIVSFFSNGSYKSVQFGLVYSSGIAVTWPGAIGWFLGQNLLAARISCAFFSWLFSLWLGFCFFREERCSRIESIVIPVFLWAWTVTSPFALPYWLGFLHNLGELNAVLLIGFGLFFLSRKLFFSTFLFGLAVWQGKLIYLPFVAVILLGHLLALKLPAKQLIKKSFLCFLTFMSPFLIWILWLSLKFGIPTMIEWITGQYQWVNFMMSHHQKVLSHNLVSGLERFNSPTMEWASYSIGTKMKNIMLSLGAIGITFVGVLLGHKKILPVSNQEKLITIFLACAIAVHTIGHFFFHPFMWQRHFQPSLYIGFGLFVFWLTKWIKSFSFNARPWLYIAALLLLSIQTIQGSKNHLLDPQGSYARSCVDLYGSSCARPH